VPRSYPPNWPELATAVKEAAGWRCERCQHIHEPATGHTLTVAHLDPEHGDQRWNLAALCQRCHLKYEHRLSFRAALCQRCHLKYEHRLSFRQGYMFAHSAWFESHLAGYRLAEQAGTTGRQPVTQEPPPQ